MSSTATSASRPLAVAIGLLAAARRARAFHPVGRAFHATVVLDGGAAHPLAGLAGRHAAVVRTSRGAGLPAMLPDVHGLAIRLLRPADPTDLDESVLDLLLSSAGNGRVLRHVLRPGRDPLRPTYSSLAPFADETGRRFVIGARFAGSDVVELLVARPFRGWRPAGEVVLGAPVGDEEAEDLRFDPFTCPPGIEPVGAVNDLRRPAYRASQARRPTPLRGGRPPGGCLDPAPDGSTKPC